MKSTIIARIVLCSLCMAATTYSLSVGNQQQNNNDFIKNNNKNNNNNNNNDGGDGKTPCQRKLENDEKRRAALRKEMLDLFGMQFRPNPDLFGHLSRNTISAKRYMYDLYKTSVTADCVQQEEQDTNVTLKMVKDADTVVSFVNTNALVPRPNVSDEAGSMYFDVESNFVVKKTLASELRIFLDVANKTVRDTRLRINLYEIVIPKRRYRKLVSTEINASRSAWHGLDVLDATKRWKENPTSNNGVLVVCQTLDKKIKLLTDCGLVDFKAESENKPFLVSFYQSGDEEEILAEQVPWTDAKDGIYKSSSAQQRSERKRRAMPGGLKGFFPPQVGNIADGLSGLGMPNFGGGKHKNNTSQCKPKALYIGFKDLGWSDWIMAPEGYKARFCQGECKFASNDHTNASTNHALIQTLVNLMFPKYVPPPCCAPIRLEPLQVLFLDERNNVIMKKYANMIVNDCACQ